MAQKIIDVDASKSIKETLQALQLPRRPLLVLLGGFDAPLADQVRSSCRRVIAPAAVDPGALILDDGRSSGCASVIGQTAADQDQPAQLLAVVPHDRLDTDIDPNHDLVLRLPALWPDPIKYMFQIADALVETGGEPEPVLTILFGGAAAETKAILRSAEREWPVLVVKGSGGLADAIADAKTPLADGSMPPTPADPDLREILETARIYMWPLGGAMDDIRRILMGRIERRSETAVSTLAKAWQYFDDIDFAAGKKQTQFRRIETALILLSIFAALFAILSTVKSVPAALQPYLTALQRYLPSDPIHIVVILIPIAISIIGAYNSHFRQGIKWVLLRGAAEALKREIFRFRAKAGVYSDLQCAQSSRESKLAARIRDITSALEQSEVNKTDLGQQPAGDSKRAAFLDPDEYVEARLRDQATYFAAKTRSLSRQLVVTQASIYLVGGIGTFLAAIRLDLLIALTAAIAAGLGATLQANQVETSLVQYNQSLASLRNIETWWKALSTWEKSRPNNIDLLVDQTEKTLESETAGWVQQMQSALEKLTEKEQPEKASAATA